MHQKVDEYNFQTRYLPSEMVCFETCFLSWINTFAEFWHMIPEIRATPSGNKICEAHVDVGAVWGSNVMDRYQKAEI